jgi:hypothetical protein
VLHGEKREQGGVNHQGIRGGTFRTGVDRLRNPEISQESDRLQEGGQERGVTREAVRKN